MKGSGSALSMRRLDLFPLTTVLEQDARGELALSIGGCRLSALAAEFGTPLYCFDAATLNDAAEQYRVALASAYPGSSAVTYAGKAYLALGIVRWVQRQGLWLDCTGAGELAIAVRAGLARERILVHGVHKSDEDLAAAVRFAAVIVVDNLPELYRLSPLLHAASQPPALWLRVRPGVAVETHTYRQTGQEESKFGMAPSEVMVAVRYCLAQGHELSGLHFHQGSHFEDPAPIGAALATVLDLAVELRAATGWQMQTLCPGGGWGVAYHEEALPQPSVAAEVGVVAQQVVAGCRQRGLELPVLHLEPGRSLVARGGVALYRVGAVKETASRRWLLIDGGMADNPRPALYGARYSALPVCAPDRLSAGPVWIAGPYCESGDILIQGLEMPLLEAGELLAVPVSGAYQLSMQSNYNGARRPAVLWLENGSATLIQRRETLADLFDRDLD